MERKSLIVHGGGKGKHCTRTQESGNAGERQSMPGLWQRCRRCTHVDLDVEVLEVEGVLPDVDADDGDVREERVLVGGGGDLETLRLRVHALCRSSAY